MRLYNTQTLSVSELVPVDGHIGIYICGVTPYDTTHAGHAFTFLTYDIVVRYLRHCGVDVTYVQNVTDIDDDILRKARERNMPWDQLAREETDRYLRDMANLNALPFDHYVAATQHVPEMQDIIVKLIDRIWHMSATAVCTSRSKRIRVRQVEPSRARRDVAGGE